MAVVAKYRVGETLRGLAFPLDLGLDPVTGAARVPAGSDVFSLVMRNRSATIPTAQTRLLTVLDDGPYTINGESYDVIYYWAPVDGDFDEGGVYDWVVFRETSGGDLEVIPSDNADDFQFEVDWTPADEEYAT